MSDLRSRIADEISSIQVGSGYESTTIGITAALEAADALIAAGVVSEEPEGRRQFTAAYRATNGNVISLETPNVLREAAERTVAEFADEDTEGPDYFVATRILPPWVPVKQEGAETDA